MSWDAILVKTSDPNFTKPRDDAALIPMGNPAEVRARLDSAVPGLEWSQRTQGHVQIGNLSLEFSFLGKISAKTDLKTIQPPGEKENVESVGVSARGEGDPVSILVKVAKLNHWSLGDGQEGGWIDLSQPSMASWKGFTEFRDRAVENLDVESAHGSHAFAVNLTISAFVFLALALVVKRAFT